MILAELKQTAQLVSAPREQFHIGIQSHCQLLQSTARTPACLALVLLPCGGGLWKCKSKQAVKREYCTTEHWHHCYETLIDGKYN